MNSTLDEALAEIERLKAELYESEFALKLVSNNYDKLENELCDNNDALVLLTKQRKEVEVIVDQQATEIESLKAEIVRMFIELTAAKIELGTRTLAANIQDIAIERDQLNLQLEQQAAETERLEGILLHANDGAAQQESKIAVLEAEIERLKAEGEKDYTDMRKFQAKFIESDQKFRSLELLVEQQMAEIERLTSLDYSKEDQRRADALSILQKEHLALEKMAESYRAMLAKLCDAVEWYASTGNIEVYYHENPKSPCLSDAVDEARKALEGK